MHQKYIQVYTLQNQMHLTSIICECCLGSVPNNKIKVLPDDFWSTFKPFHSQVSTIEAYSSVLIHDQQLNSSSRTIKLLDQSHRVSNPSQILSPSTLRPGLGVFQRILFVPHAHVCTCQQTTTAWAVKYINILYSNQYALQIKRFQTFFIAISTPN